MVVLETAPSLPVVVSTLVPSFLVSVLVTEPSLFLVVSVLTVPSPGGIPGQRRNHRRWKADRKRSTFQKHR